MKILHLNTFDQYGGAAIAAKRVFEAIRQQESHELRLLVQQRDGEDKDYIKALDDNFLGKYWAKSRFVGERLYYLPQCPSKLHRFSFSPAYFGANLAQHPWVKWADILHFHWLQFGFLSWRGIEQLLNLGKPVVWTLHDMWAFTGGCHYVGDCTHYQQACHTCPQLKKPKSQDLSNQLFVQKKRTLSSNLPLKVICSSEWLSECARKSKLLAKFAAERIFTPIDLESFSPINKQEAQNSWQITSDKCYFLFGAMNTADPRKGFSYFKKALHILQKKYPETHQSIALLVFGKFEDKEAAHFPYPVKNLGVLKTEAELCRAYSAAHAFVIPTLEDNLPNTVIESLACATPVIGFEVGGLPEMIEPEQDGYLANYRDAESLAAGMYWLWQKWQNGDGINKISQQARQNACQKFDAKSTREAYTSIYENLLTQYNG